MLHTTTEFIWRLRCLYRAINMRMIATQEWNMEHKLAIMLIVESVTRPTSCCGGGRPLEYAPDASLLVQASYHVHRPWVLLGTPSRGLNLKNGTFKTWKYNWKVLWSTHWIFDVFGFCQKIRKFLLYISMQIKIEEIKTPKEEHPNLWVGL